MKQTRWASFGETALNTFAGFGLSLFLQWLYFDVWLGFPLHIVQNLTFAVLMTAVSLARGFSIRRLCEAIGIRVKLSAAMQAVIAERRRHKSDEGWDDDHDDKHAHGELARAGACYALAGSIIKPTDRHRLVMSNIDEYPRRIAINDAWPWDSTWWKPKLADVRRDLVRAGALILAEIERFDRNRKKPQVVAAPRQPLPPSIETPAAIKAAKDRGFRSTRKSKPRRPTKVVRKVPA